MKQKITKDMTIGEIAEKYPKAIDILLKRGLHCFGCHVADWETLEQGAAAHGITGKSFEKLLSELNRPQKRQGIN